MRYQTKLFEIQPVGTIMFSNFEGHYKTFIKISDDEWRDYEPNPRNFGWGNKEFAGSWDMRNDGIAFA